MEAFNFSNDSALHISLPLTVQSSLLLATFLRFKFRGNPHLMTENTCIKAVIQVNKLISLFGLVPHPIFTCSAHSFGSLLSYLYLL